MEKWKKRSINLLFSLILGSDKDPSVIPPYPQKTEILRGESRFFKRLPPESRGISSKRLYNMLSALEAERMANVHSIMVLCRGAVICECSSDDYRINDWHISHSMAKTITGILIAMLIDDGALSYDKKVCDIFPEIAYKDKRFSEITVDHLLSMSAGVEFAEVGAVTEQNWLESFFASVIRFAPGSKFAYNSMNSYILAKIAERVSSESFSRLVRERIFAPMGIESYYWEKSPDGTEKGGWGLYMSAESWAKFGVLLLHRGDFFGKRILSEQACDKILEHRIDAEENIGGFNYAGHIWISNERDQWLINGMLGQNVWICPKNDIVVVMMSGNTEFFQESAALRIIRNHLGGEINDKLYRADRITLAEKQKSFFKCRSWITPRESGYGWLYKLGILKHKSYDKSWDKIIGEYDTVSRGVGILPLFLRTMQNSIGKGLERVRFYEVGNRLYFGFREGGEDVEVEIGIGEYKRSCFRLRGETMLVSSIADCMVDKSGRMEYRIELIFPETANRRRMSIKKIGKDRIMISMSEQPDGALIENMLKIYSGQSHTLGLVVDVIERRFGEKAISDAIKRSFEPTIFAVNINSESYEELMSEEVSRANDLPKSLRLIRSIVDKFFSENLPSP